MRKSTPKRSCSILPKWKKGVKTAAHMYHPSHREYPPPRGVKSMFQVTWRANILLAHIPFVPCQLALAFLWYNYFQIWSCKSKAKVTGEVKVTRLAQSKGPTIPKIWLTTHLTIKNRDKILGKTKTPAFWGYPAALWLRILLIHIGSQVKTRQSQSFKF